MHRSFGLLTVKGKFVASSKSWSSSKERLTQYSQRGIVLELQYLMIRNASPDTFHTDIANLKTTVEKVDDGKCKHPKLRPCILKVKLSKVSFPSSFV